MVWADCGGSRLCLQVGILFSFPVRKGVFEQTGWESGKPCICGHTHTYVSVHAHRITLMLLEGFEFPLGLNAVSWGHLLEPVKQE